ncbi:TIGR01777 family oxidoreductase [Ferruginibacter albus]|uniref:TIGR01777 family oxidoreductase n=1 Tax=Ferruginibacter albus TaxID=2875540 RepID=UPI001CC59040|nr:TIGR01777 family oxidoreductase [Ferruginibacter albus]UAY52463.1 TIGR01777 family oxidoreductase [Ferruginibacter albus]
MKTVIIAGGTGLVGKALSKKLTKRNYKVIILTRKIANSRSGTSDLIEYAEWNTENGTIDTTAIGKADYIINLAGAGVMDKRWNASYKQLIQQSRVKSCQLIVQALTKYPNNIKAVINASAIGWYGADKNPVVPFVETNIADNGFLGETCKLWEESIEPVTALGKRLVKLRTGIVLSKSGGAFPEFKRSLTFSIAAILGTGKQIISWIHIDDLCNLYIDAIEKEDLQGVYNAVAVQPICNKDLMLALAKKLKGKFFIPINVPAFILKLILGEQSIEVLKSATVSNQKILDAGFKFLYSTIDEALKELV